MEQLVIVQEEQILKVQLSADGRVWYADGMETPTVSADDHARFTSTLSHRSIQHIRVLGTPENAQLIVDIYQKCCSPRRVGRLEVASPMICSKVSERSDPTISLYRMRQCQLSPSLGGWHQVDELDYPSYAIAAQFAKNEDYGDHVRKLLLTHPAYHDLSFLPTLGQEAAARLIAIILDPRWFVDFRSPDRLSRLKTYLGLTPRHMLQVTNGTGKCDRAKRCAIALQAWQGNVNQSEIDYTAPGNFLWRRWKSSGGGFRGNLRATQTFVTYFIRTWQQQLLSKSRQQLEMFIPDNLLRGAEVAAYKVHAAGRQVA